MAFSDLLKDAQNTQVQTLKAQPATSSASVMTLSLDEPMTSAYTGYDTYAEDEWTLSSKYETTEKNTVGRRYSDENYSTVDEKRNVKIDPSQINLTQESNSQYIPFIMPRYFDGIDLMNMTLLIYYLNENEAEGWADPINVCYNSTHIKFGWVLTELETALKGKLTFEIHAKGIDPLGRKYLLKTKPNSQLEVLESLHGNGAIIYDETWATSFLDTVEGYKDDAEQASALAGKYLEEIVQIIANTESDLTGYSKTEVNDLLNLKADLYLVENLQNDVLDNTLDISKLTEYVGTIPEENTSTNIVSYIQEILLKYYTQEEINQMFDEFDISGQLIEVEERIGNLEDDFANFDGLAALNITYDENTNTLSFFNGEEKIKDIELNINNVLNPIKNDLKKLQDDVGDLPKTLSTSYYTKTDVDTKLALKANTDSVAQLGTVVENLSQVVDTIDKSPRTKYKATYGTVELEDGSTAEHMFTLWKEENGVETVQDRFKIMGGGGGSTSNVTMKINYVEDCPRNSVFAANDNIIIKYNYEGVDLAGDDIGGTATWKVRDKVVLTEEVSNGINSVDLSDYVSTGSYTITLTITHSSGAIATKEWKLEIINVSLDSTFDETSPWSLENIPFSYTVHGKIDKTVHFVLDGTEIGTEIISSSGIQKLYYLPSLSHGSHLLEVYVTAEMNGKILGIEEIIDEESGEVIGYNHTIKIVKDIICMDSTSNIPVIGCANQIINTKQYNTVDIKYVVIDPKTETPEVTWYKDGEVLRVETLTDKKDGYYSFQYKATTPGTFKFTITCKDAEPKEITLNVEELGIDVEVVKTGLAFDFNPTIDYLNSSENTIWSDNGVTMTLSDNFDLVNGGYQTDENNDKYFCVKAGTTATINYNLFADEPKKTGKEFKVIFRTKNIRKRDTTIISCMDSGIGLDMKVEEATIYNSGGSLKSNHCEDTIIEYEFNINKDSDMKIVMTYEDGTPSKPCEYTELSSFKQTNFKPITIGSADCDVHIYRMRAYSNSLTDTDIKNNFIADARNAEEMIARYTRNQIYNDNGLLVTTESKGDFSAEALMKAAPNLRYVFLEVPRFTTGKDDKVPGCNVYYRYPAGTRPHDNWDCTGMTHRGQGTSSEFYGPSGRNIDLVMDTDTSVFKWKDEQGVERTSSTITLTDTSIPTDYLNIKTNIASSENANNAQMTRRFNEFQPFLRYARKKDSRVKDTMEFYNCVVFIRETEEDVDGAYPTHIEFNDTNWHFYGIGNIGDSKKTDDTRVNNANDPKEHIVEIMDADDPLCTFPTGKENNAICPIDEWKAGNTVYDMLYSTDYVYNKKGEFESFGGTTFEFRYEMDDITDEQREENINTWRNLYKFIATSSDEEFYTHLKDYFVVDSALYYYLFTERYTMVDNRAKNSFWHYGKVYISNAEAVVLGEKESSYYIIDDEAAVINEGYRYDLTFGYDMDTCLGIDNTGDYVFSYGKEDNDYYIDGDPTSRPIYRAHDSVFFCRLRDLFPTEMQILFKDREGVNAWSSTTLISQWDNAQAQFPEELWRLDYERKYYRPYLGLSIDNSIPRGIDKGYLIGKFFGRKKYSRRQFERNQEIYFATKYFGKKALDDVFWFRGVTASIPGITPNYSLTLVPYSDMYVCVQYGSTGTPIHKKAKAGQTCYFENNSTTMDFVYVYAAGYIQEVGDLSRCYPGDNTFTPAVRLQKLVIGSKEPGYNNTYMKSISVANNPLLEYLDLSNISGLDSTIDLSGCSNIKELYAEGTNATGVIFANGGLLEKAYLPSVKSLSMKNLSNITEFIVEGYDNLEELVVENTPNINTYEIICESPNLKIVRLINLNWDSTYNIKNGDIFDRLLKLRGKDSSGYETDVSVLTGYAYILIGKQKQLEEYKKIWNELEIEPKETKVQYTVTFVNEDGKILETQYVIEGESAIDPTTRAENPLIPVKESSTQYDYIFSGWDNVLTNVFSDRTITAIYSSTVRNYTIKYYNPKTNMIMQTIHAPYGTMVNYTGIIPTYTDEEELYKYYLFNDWDTSGYVNCDKTINAIFDEFKYTNGCFDEAKLSEMSPVEIYALTKLAKLANSPISIKNIIENGDEYSFKLGYDVGYDIPSEVIISDGMYFNGNNHYDTGIKLFDIDKDFVLAMDYEFLTGCANNSVLAECYQNNGSNGFQLSCQNDNVNLSWGGKTQSISKLNNREMLILRHIKGDTNLHVYNSNLDDIEVSVIDMTRAYSTICNSTLVLGASKPEENSYENKAIGNINWCKIWYQDIGDELCRKLAIWTHEEITCEVSGFNRYYLSGQDTRCTFSLLGKHLLERDRCYNNATSSTNTGGWAKSDLNKFLNQRMYNALSSQIKALIKQVVVKSSIGDKSTEISTSDCYITIPAILDVDKSQEGKVPYSSEVNSGTAISYITGEDERKRAYDNGVYGMYWLRSPYIPTTNTKYYVWQVEEDGSTTGFGTPNNNTKAGVLIELSF